MIDKILFIGTGVMGAPMAGHLVDAGLTVYGQNRDFSHTKRLSEQYGFHPVEKFDQVIDQVDAVFTMVGFPKDLEQLYLTPHTGLLDLARPGLLFADFTTSSPSLAQQLDSEAKKRGCSILDAPVSGGDTGAKAGTLVMMCGGDKEAFQILKPTLDLMTSSVSLLGSAGSGQHCKAVNQIAVAGATAAYTEALLYCLKVGLDPHQVLAVIGGGAAGSWQLSRMAPRALSGDCDPGFFIKHFLKDLAIVQEESTQRNLELPVTALVQNLYHSLADKGLEDLGTQALFKAYQEKLHD